LIQRYKQLLLMIAFSFLSLKKFNFKSQVTLGVFLYNKF